MPKHLQLAFGERPARQAWRVRGGLAAGFRLHRARTARRGQLPVIDVQHVRQRPACGGAEGAAGVVGGGDQRALADVTGQAQQPGDLRLVSQVQRRPGGPESPGRQASM